MKANWNIKQGDMIRWVVITSREEIIPEGLQIFSSTMDDMIDVSKNMLLISYADDEWLALCEGQLIHAHEEDDFFDGRGHYYVRPRVV
jgi:hypothetical protein